MAKAEKESGELSALIEQLIREAETPIENKTVAAIICHVLIRQGIESGAFAERSYLHSLGLRLMEYIKGD
jgi:hypothetical protein